MSAKVVKVLKTGKVLQKKSAKGTQTKKSSSTIKNRKSKTLKKRGRPRGQSNDKKSYGPLGDLIRRRRIAQHIGLSEVARACNCSVQFISNIEHGRAPLPWEKAEKLAKTLDVPMAELQAANLTVRSDFQKFASAGKGNTRGQRKTSGRLPKGGATEFPLPTDPEFQNLIQKYLAASEDRRRKFINQAKDLL